LLGTEPRRIATFAQYNGMGQGTVEDAAMSTIEFEGGVLAQTHESFVAENAVTRVHVLGTQGSLYAIGSLSQSGEAVLEQRDARGTRDIPVPTVDLYEVGFAAFVKACAGRGQPLASGADGAKSMAVALAALQSAKSGRAETIDPGL
jgi:1,5-anhydro-D-fructose reductase (1,5-anhydro-D-mannitol-forming)